MSEPCLLVNVPGPVGPAGAAGANGTNGVDAFTLTTVPFAMPAFGASTAVSVAESGWIAINQLVYVGDPAGAARGTFRVVAMGAGTVTLNNVATVGGAYADNSAPGTIFPTGSTVSPGGQQGVSGAVAAGSAPDSSTYITQTPDGALPNSQALSGLASGLMFSTIATGVVTMRAVGVANTNFAPIDTTFTNGDVVFATGVGLQTKTAAATRTALGIGTIATQAASAVAITGGTIAGTAISTSSVSATTLMTSGASTIGGTLSVTNLMALTPSALQTLAAANLITVAAPKVRVVGNAAPVVMTSTPTIALGTMDGQELLVQGTSDANTVTLQDDASLAGSKLRLGATSRVLGAGDTVRFSWIDTRVLARDELYRACIMAAPNNGATVDGVSVVTKGMNSGVAPRLIPSAQVAMAVNLTFRNGLPRTRPVLHKVPLTYSTDAIHKNATASLFQVASFHQAYGSGENCLVALIGGHLFRYAVGSTNVVQDISVSKATTLGANFSAPAVNSSATMTVASTADMKAGMIVSLEGGNYQIVSVTDATHVLVRNLDTVAGTFILLLAPPQVVTIYTDLNNPLNPDAWAWQAEDFTIVNNGQSDPLFFDGAGTRRSKGAAGEELPAGCMGAYVNGRVWMALPNVAQRPSQAFMAGDLVYSHGFADGYNGRAAVLKTEENTFFSGGGAFSVPVEAGSITAMSSVAIADTSLGQGALQVMTAGSVFSVQVPFLREDWAATSYPLMTVGLPGYGALSQLAVVRVNGDLWYRAHDGLRSYQVGRRDLGTWVNTPLSVEVEKILNLDSDLLLAKANGILFDNRLIETCSPLTTERGVAHRGAIALDFNGISTLTSRAEPAYDGLWTGLRVLQWVKGVFNGEERAFAFAIDACERICLYELLKTDADWFDHDGVQRSPVQSSFETRSMGWGDGGNCLKRLVCADVYLDRLAGNPGVAMAFQYRSDEDPTWRAWHGFTLCAPVEDCATASCPTFDNVREQYRTFLRLPEPSDTCSPITKRMTRTGYEFQARVSVTGFFQLNRLHAWASVISDSMVVACPSSETCVLLKGCDEPWFSYEIEVSECGDPIAATGVPATPPVTPGPTVDPWVPPPDLPPPVEVPPPTVTCRTCSTPVWPPQDGAPPTDVGAPTPTCRVCGTGTDTERPPPVPVGEPTPGGDPARHPVCPDNLVGLSTPIEATDPVAGGTHAVGVYPANEPDASQNPHPELLEPGVLDAWSAAVWSAWDAEKIANAIPQPASEYITWWYYPISGKNWDANDVFARPTGGWPNAYGKIWKLVIAHC